MGNARWKWMQRVKAYEDILDSEGLAAAKRYMEQFNGKLEKFLKGAADLAIERADAESEELAGRRDVGYPEFHLPAACLGERNEI